MIEDRRNNHHETSTNRCRLNTVESSASPDMLCGSHFKRMIVPLLVTTVAVSHNPLNLYARQRRGVSTPSDECVDNRRNIRQANRAWQSEALFFLLTRARTLQHGGQPGRQDKAI
jgi:hypothetical protein